MKKILITLSLFLYIISFSQSLIYNIHEEDFANVNGAYYKDLDNYFDQFEGTWKYTDANITIRFRFEKKEMFVWDNIMCYYDLLVGEMQFIENGIEKINSLNNLNNSSNNKFYYYNLNGFTRVGNYWYPKCIDCVPNTDRLLMNYDEPQNDDFGLEAVFLMRRADENGVQKIKVQYQFISGAYGTNKDLNGPSTSTGFLIPYGNYTLIKE